MRKIYICITILLCSGFLKAQLDSFDLSTYKLPDIKRHVLDFNFDFDGSMSANGQYYRNQGDDYNRYNYFDGDFDLNYTFHRNSDKIQSKQMFNFDFSPSFSDYKNEDNLLSESLDLRGSIFLKSENRFYYNTNRFIETNLEFYLSRSKSESHYYSDTDLSYVNSINFSIPINVGFGRIEEIQDARLAIYILDDLNKQGSLSRIPNEEEILEFAQLISKLKSERIFDSRKKKIYEIEEVDAFLQSKGLINNPNSKYFTVVNDNWDFAALPYRRSGQRISFGIEPELNNYNSDSKYDDGSTLYRDIEYLRKEYGVSININYKREKPINLYWQSIFSIRLSGKYLDGINENKDLSIFDKSEIQSQQIISSVYYSLSFYPSTRTDMTLSMGAYFQNSFGEENVNTENNNITYLEITPNSQININYYISPQFKLNFRYSIYYRYLDSNSAYYSNIYNDFATRKSLNHQIGIGFVYQIL